MPDFERPLRDLRKHLTKDAKELDVLEAYYKGRDDARKEIVIVVALLAMIVCAVLLVVVL